MVDADGEFLLVEAADALPRWLSPENSDHRVGHFIPLRNIFDEETLSPIPY